jgi:hypothetical protein
MFRRETIIALRARHQSHRVASDVLYTDVEVPRPPEPAIPGGVSRAGPTVLSEAEMLAILKQRRRAQCVRNRSLVVAVFALSFASLVAYIIRWHWSHPSP